MTVHVPTYFQLRHIDRLPQPMVLGLASTVVLLHAILVAIALGNIPLVEPVGNAGGGNGIGDGNKALIVSVLQSSPSPSEISAVRQPLSSAEKPIPEKKKKLTELIATTATARKTSPEIKVTRKSPAEQVSQLAEDKKTIPDTRFPSVGPAHSTQKSNPVGGIGTGNDKGNGAGSGVGQGKGNGASGIGTGGTGNGVPRSVSLSSLRYKRAVKPEYPPRSIQKYESGQVNVRVVVDTAGRVQDARVVLSSGFSRLDEAALKAARHSTFHPYTEHGRPLFAMAIIPYRFNLSNK